MCRCGRIFLCSFVVYTKCLLSLHAFEIHPLYLNTFSPVTEWWSCLRDQPQGQRSHDASLRQMFLGLKKKKNYGTQVLTCFSFRY